MKGPIKINEKQYADYDVGVYDDASYHALEGSSYKQVMGRVTVNPFGANSRYDSLGLTGYYDYGYRRGARQTRMPSTRPAGISPGPRASALHC